MRITDPQVILNGEKDLIASVQKDLDLDAIKDLLKERLAITPLSPKGGRIVVHNNDVAFRLDYEINVNGSLLFDREGNLIEEGESTTSGQDALQNQEAEQQSDLDDNLPEDLPDSHEALAGDPEQDQADTDDDAPLTLDTLADDEQDEDYDLQDTDTQDAESALEIEDLEDESAFDQDDSYILEAGDGNEAIDDLSKANDIENLSINEIDELPELELEEEDKNTIQNDDIVDDDISDILQESREFWEKKKE